MAEQDPKTDWKARRTQVARDMLRRQVDLVRDGPGTVMAPDFMRNEPALYTSPERHAAELRNIFLKEPLVAGLSRDIAAPGDVLLFDAVGPKVFLVRGRDGVARGFLNMCPHRGAQLVRDCSRRSRISCPFHAWTFDLTGSLIGLPGADGFDGLDKAALGLIEVPVAEWHGILLVRLDPHGPPIDAAAHLAAMGPELAQVELAGAEPVKSGVLRAQSNWKFALDTYGEGYHFAALHASTIGQTHYNNVALFEPMGRHFRISFPHKGIGRLAGQDEADWPEADYSAVHYVFPNTVFFIGSIEPGKVFVQVFRLFPGDHVGEMQCRFAVYAPGGVKDDAHRTMVEMAYDATAEVVDSEDYRVAAEGYANMLTAPAGFRTTFGRNEPALQHLQRAIAEAAGMPLP